MFGIPPSLSVLAARVEADASPAREACVDAVDRQGLEQWTGDVIYLDRDRARREYDQALQDAAWVDKMLAAERRAAAARTDGAGCGPSPRDEGAGGAARRSQAARARRPL